MEVDKLRSELLLAIVWLFFQYTALAQTNSFAHPLDPLSKDEIALAAKVVKDAGKATTASRFQTIVLNEPPKEEVLGFKPGDVFRREAFVIVYERTANKTFDGVVDLRSSAVKTWREVPGAQPSFMLEDVFIVQTVVRSNPKWQAAMRKRGITEFNKVQIEPWPAGNYGFKDEEGVRLIRALSYYRGESKMPYAHPVEGVVAVVDLNKKRVLKLIDSGVVPVPKADFDIDEKSVEQRLGKLREAPKPLHIVQPNGASLEIRGHEIRWQKWRFRYALHPREGLVLYTVGYEDGGKVRSVLYRASLSEMVVPYGDPSESWFFRNAFDAGEAMVGSLALPLVERTDVPENAVLMNAVRSSESGSAIESKNVIGLYERDGGVLWKHVDYLTNTNESRRGRQLVLTYFANVGNYEYGFNWVFHQDGALEMEALLTGVMSTKGVLPINAEHGNHNGKTFGHLVADGVEAVHHQHFFNFRLDMDVDGTANTVIEQNTEVLPPGKNNPYNNAFVMKHMPLKTELTAQRQLNLATHRRWLVVNPNHKNSLGQPTGFLLSTGENSIPLAAINSSVRRRAGFVNSHLWVTPQAADEIYAAGLYINQNKGGEGLPDWTKRNRTLENKDVVMWYTFGVTHIPRPEDWPVMPVHKAGFKLMPVGFFTQNPAMDVPKQTDR
jgi:primary-amine oxidase